MSNPTVQVLGVYRLDVTEDLFREHFDILYGYPMSADKLAKTQHECREFLQSVVLIEIVVSNRDEHFHVHDFQSFAGQVAYAEAYLTLDGEALSVKRWSDMPPDDPLRMAFFLAQWNPQKSLRTSYGPVQCPMPQQMPDRLKRLAPFEPFD
jgi:hypothetical protein